MLVSPAERDPAILALGKTSSVPEDYGADMLAFVHTKQAGTLVVGIQRKEWKDLLASVNDGRLAKEVQQMTRCDVAVLVLEGRLAWTGDGKLVKGYGPEWTRDQLWGLMWSLQAAGVWVMTTGSAQETADLAASVVRWCRKDRHTSLAARGPAPRGVWGTRPDDKTFGAWVLQGIPGVGPTVARAVVEELGMPLGWTVTVEDLCRVPGVGKGKATQMLRCLPTATMQESTMTLCASCREPSELSASGKATAGDGTGTASKRKARSRARSGSSTSRPRRARGSTATPG